MAYAPTLTGFTDMNPCPRVEVFFPALAVGTATVTVYRMSGGREYKVRGAVDAVTAGSLSRIDFEAPAVAASYRAEMFDGAGLSLGFTDSASIMLGFEDSVLHNPTAPAGAVKVSTGAGQSGITSDSARSLSRPVPGSVSYPIGRSVGVIIAEPRRGLAGLVLGVRCSTIADADAVQALLGGYDDRKVPVVCIRLGMKDQGVRIPQPLFLGVLDIAEQGLDVFYGGSQTRQVMQGDEVAPPVPGLYVPLLRRKDINAFFATRAAVKASALTRAAVNRRYDLAGYGG